MDVRCKNCVFWETENDKRPLASRKKTCTSPKMLKGYGIDGPPIDGALVEDDEGWAIITGPEFGCVNFSPRESEKDDE